MNMMLRTAGIVGLLTTITTIISKLWGEAPSIIHFIAQNSPLFYAFAAGIAVGAFTRSLWVILSVIAVIFLVLKYVGF